MTENCCSTAQSTIMLLPCSGGSNTGQLANRAAVELTMEGFGKIFCLAGIGGRLSGFIQSAKDVESLVVIDGCEIACAKATLESAGVPVRQHLVVTEYGIEKNKDFNLSLEDLDLVKQAVQNTTLKSTSETGDLPSEIPSTSVSGCCCTGGCQ